MIVFFPKQRDAVEDVSPLSKRYKSQKKKDDDDCVRPSVVGKSRRTLVNSTTGFASAMMVCVLGDYYVKSVLCGVFFVRPHLYVFFSLFLSPPRGPLWVDTLDSLSWALVFGRESFVLLLIVLERLDLTRGGEGGGRQ